MHFFCIRPTLISRQTILAMKFIIFFLVLGMLHASAESNGQSVTISGKAIPLKKVFKAIKLQTGYVFFYDAELLRQARPVTINIRDMPVERTLDLVFAGQPLTWKMVDKTVTVERKSVLQEFQETKKEVQLHPPINIRGIVTDENGKPLEGATIRIKGSQRGTQTNVDGFFELAGVDENLILVVSFIGFIERELRAKSNLGKIILKRADVAMDEMVIQTGYEQIPKERATGAIKVITEKDMAGKMQLNVLTNLEGLVPGFTSFQGRNLVRGESTLRGDWHPLIVVDGFPFEGEMEAINPADIESVTFLKDAPAASIYGARSANGVIVVQTKIGSNRKSELDYSNSIILTPLPDDRKYLNLMNSSEYIDFQTDMFNYFHTAYGNVNKRVPMDPFRELLYDHERGAIGDAAFNSQVEKWRKTDNRQQLIDNFLRPLPLTHQHNLALRGGEGKYSYSVSGNFTESLPNEKAQKTTRVGYNVRNSYQFFKWLKVDFGLMGSTVKSNFSNGFSASGYLNAGAPYLNLFDEDGTPIPWDYSLYKSHYEIDRLVGLGLYDETFYPVEELHKKQQEFQSNYLKANFAFNFKIMPGISFNLMYQMENTNSRTANLRDEDSYFQKTIVNDATVITNGQIKRYIPEGNYIQEQFVRVPAYTLRGQFNINKNISKSHSINGIIGAERRAKKSNTSLYEKWGFDKTTLQHKYVDESFLTAILTGTESLNGQFRYLPASPIPTYKEIEDRFIALYSNASYEIKKRYVVSGSIRMDQSNLFGQDPRLQYKPIWSAGVRWKMGREQFMQKVDWINRLDLRLTHGINGNITKLYGPYLRVSYTEFSPFVNDFAGQILTPPNSGLTWENTHQTNFGLDLEILNNRLSVTLDYYLKSTGNLYDNQAVDPTSGFIQLYENYADMYNKGLEISVNSKNVSVKNVEWQTIFNFAINKNRLTNLANPSRTPTTMIAAALDIEGNPMKNLYSIRWAGLDENGRPQAYLKDGKTIVKSFAEITHEDLINEGTTRPVFSGSLSNHFNYKGFSVSAMFVYYGGNVLRAAYTPYIINTEVYKSTLNKNIINHWKQPGDENDPEMAPAIYRSAPANVQNLWKGADKHVQKGDYVKLRDLIFGYRLPKHLAAKIGSASVNINLQIRDLFYLARNKYGYDPESWNGEISVPSIKAKTPVTYTLGVSLTF